MIPMWDIIQVIKLLLQQSEIKYKYYDGATTTTTTFKMRVQVHNIVNIIDDDVTWRSIKQKNKSK